MSFHRNAQLGLAGRYALVCAIGEQPGYPGSFESDPGSS